LIQDPEFKIQGSGFKVQFDVKIILNLESLTLNFELVK